MRNVSELKTIELVKEITKLYMKDFFSKKDNINKFSKKIMLDFDTSLKEAKEFLEDTIKEAQRLEIELLHEYINNINNPAKPKIKRRKRFLKKNNSEKFNNIQKLYFESADYTFAPSYDLLKKIKKGDSVMVCLCQERFWVEVTEINNNELKGIVDNYLLFTENHGLKFGDVVKFSLENVYKIN